MFSLMIGNLLKRMFVFTHLAFTLFKLLRFSHTAYFILHVLEIVSSNLYIWILVCVKTK